MKMHGNPVVLTDFDHKERNFATYMAFIHTGKQEARGTNVNTEKFGVNKWIE